MWRDGQTDRQADEHCKDRAFRGKANRLANEHESRPDDMEYFYLLFLYVTNDMTLQLLRTSYRSLLSRIAQFDSTIKHKSNLRVGCLIVLYN
jgi:hypothetical protein